MREEDTGMKIDPNAEAAEWYLANYGYHKTVKCIDCVHSLLSYGVLVCTNFYTIVKDDFFCADGETKNGGKKDEGTDLQR